MGRWDLNLRLIWVLQILTLKGYTTNYQGILVAQLEPTELRENSPIYEYKAELFRSPLQLRDAPIK